ncbi:hypothetical protein V5O48_015134 [Marasmius crinis-equi]|uniref:Uncharacterized protein n=1 Tax=Marasmius crinis-equi TaxID=585013 RepID=A0ABR3EVD1_9AGAR
MPKAPRTPRKTKSRTPKSSLSPESPSKKKSELKADWNEWVEGHIWQPEQGTVFRFPSDTTTVTKTDAVKLDNVKPKLPPRDLDVLKHETRFNKAGRIMYLYSKEEVRDLIRRRADMCGYEVPTPPTIATIGFLNGPAEVIEPHIDHSYVRVESDPVDIIWEGQHVWSGWHILFEDACILYNVEADVLEDLAVECRWLDIKTVAMRAVKAHGGVIAHNESIAQKRRAAVKALVDNYEITQCYRGPLEHFSKSLRDRFKKLYGGEDYGYDGAPTWTPEEKARTVQQYYPIGPAFDTDYGTGLHFEENGRPLERHEYDWEAANPMHGR